MDTSYLDDDNKDGDEGYLSHTLPSTFWEQEDIMLSFMALHNKHNQYHNVLSHQDRRNPSGKIHHHPLQSLSQSCFMHLFNAGQGDALITVTGFSFSTFQDLLELFTQVYLRYTPHVTSGSKNIRLSFLHHGRTRQLTPTVASMD